MSDTEYEQQMETEAWLAELSPRWARVPRRLRLLIALRLLGLEHLPIDGPAYLPRYGPVVVLRRRRPAL